MPCVEIEGVNLDYERIEGTARSAPCFVMLHEGLGSVALWKDFPSQLARATGATVVAYSRAGYGRSAPIQGARTVRYLHDEALQVLPAFLDALAIENPMLFGHSDGGSIALIHAGGSARGVRGIIALAPHVMVEDITVTNIAAARVDYETGNLRARLARYHDNVDATFWGWNDIWLNPDFRAWNIEEYLPRVTCPVLAIQGEDDEYGTMAQIDLIAQAVPNIETLKLARCGHSIHRDQPQAVLSAVTRWMDR